MQSVRRRVRPRSYLLIYAFVAVVLILGHGPLLRLPYYWDEAGQFIPSALDIYRTGAWISHSATPNVHPPGVMAWLAAAWKLFGFSTLTTRISMLLLASFGVLTTFLLAIELSRGAPGMPAFVAMTLLCISPLFYAQSILAQLDMPAMGFTALALLLFLQNRFRSSAAVCVLLVMIKETGIVAPLVFGAWLLWERRGERRVWRDAFWFLIPAVPLALWLIALRHYTHHWFGNAVFTQYNVFYPLNPVRFSFALLRRLYYLLFSTGHFIGTAAVIFAWKRMPLLRDRPWRIAFTFAAIHVLAVTALGGAVLERYLLPVLPILYTAFAVGLLSLLPGTRRIATLCLAICLAAANFINPPYPFPFENNLMFVSFVELQQNASLAADDYTGEVVTTFPMTTSLKRPDNGYLTHPHKIREIPDFRASTIDQLRNNPPPLMVVYNTAIDPWHLQGTPFFSWFLGRYYDYERPLTGGEIALRLNMRVAREWNNRGIPMSLLVNDEIAGPRYGGP